MRQIRGIEDDGEFELRLLWAHYDVRGLAAQNLLSHLGFLWLTLSASRSVQRGLFAAAYLDVGVGVDPESRYAALQHVHRAQSQRVRPTRSYRLEAGR